MIPRVATPLFLALFVPCVAWGKPTAQPDTKDVSSQTVITPDILASSDTSSPTGSKPKAAKTNTGGKSGNLRLPFRTAVRKEHPQIRRARLLVNQWMSRSHGIDWRLRGRQVLPELRRRAEEQAGYEYAQYFTLVRALDQLRPNKDLNLPTTKRRARPRSPCGRVTWVTKRIGSGSRPPKAKAKAPRTLASRFGMSKKETGEKKHAARCKTQAMVLRASAENLQTVFGPIRAWKAFEKNTLRPLIGKQKKAKSPANRAEKIVLEQLYDDDKADGDKKQPIKPPLDSKRVPNRVRMLGHH